MKRNPTPLRIGLAIVHPIHGRYVVRGFTAPAREGFAAFIMKGIFVREAILLNDEGKAIVMPVRGWRSGDASGWTVDGNNSAVSL